MLAAAKAPLVPPDFCWYRTRGRLPPLEHVKDRDRLFRPSSEAVASAVL